MLYRTYKQKGGWCCDLPDWDWPDYDCCGKIIKTINVCDYLASALYELVNKIILIPFNGIIYTLNQVIKIINYLISKVIEFTVTIFNFILNIIKTPIEITNIVTGEIRSMITLIIDILTGDILSIFMVFLLPYLIYFKSVIAFGANVIRIPIGMFLNSILGLFGLDIEIPTNFSLYHLLLLGKYLLIFIYLTCVYGFLALVF